MLKTPPGPHRGSGEKGVCASLPTASPPTSCPVTCPRLPPRPLRCTSTPLTLAFAQRQASPGGAVGVPSDHHNKAGIVTQQVTQFGVSQCMEEACLRCSPFSVQ